MAWLSLYDYWQIAAIGVYCRTFSAKIMSQWFEVFSASQLRWVFVLNSKARSACWALQGNDPGYMWAMTVLSFWLKLAIGVLGACLTLLWILQVLLYIFIYPPLTPFLNDMFIRLDRVFPLFGTFAFALFCFYLISESSIASLRKRFAPI